MIKPLNSPEKSDTYREAFCLKTSLQTSTVHFKHSEHRCSWYFWRCLKSMFFFTWTQTHCSWAFFPFYIEVNCTKRIYKMTVCSRIS